MAGVPARRRQLPTGNGGGSSCGEPERKRARNVEVNLGHLKPFDHGFRREMVVRGTMGVQGARRQMSDIYYYTPTGAKLRSRPEVCAYLAQNPKLPLTADNFIFTRVAIHQPPDEVVRNAGQQCTRGKRRTGRVTRTSAKEELLASPAAAVLMSPASGTALSEELTPPFEEAKLSCGNACSGRRKARKPFCGCCDVPPVQHQRSLKFAASYNGLHRGSNKCPARGIPRTYTRDKSAIALRRRHLDFADKDPFSSSELPAAQNSSDGGSPFSWEQCEDKGEPAAEASKKTASYLKPGGEKDCIDLPSVKQPVVVVKDILRPELGRDHAEEGEKAATNTDQVLASPNVCAVFWEHTAARQLYQVLKTRHSGSGQSAVATTEDGLLGDPVILNEGTQPLAQQKLVDGSSPQSSRSRRATVSHQPCTLRCARAMGQAPELQCKRCLCFFHPICIGVERSHPAVVKGCIICKACTKLPFKSAQKSSSLKQPTPLETATCKMSSNPVATSLSMISTTQEASVLQPAVAPFLTCSSFSGPSSSAPVKLSAASSAFSKNSTNTNSVPVQLVADGGSAPQQRPLFTSNPVAPTAGRVAHRGPARQLPRLAPAPPTSAVLSSANRKYPRPLNSANGPDVMVRPNKYYTIHVVQKQGSISEEALKSVVSQLVQNYPKELERITSGGQNVILKLQPAQQQHSLLKPAAAGGAPLLQGMVPTVIGASGDTGSQHHTSVQPLEKSSQFAPKIEPHSAEKLPRQFPANAAPAAVGGGDNVAIVTSSDATLTVTSATNVGSGSQLMATNSAETGPQTVVKVEPNTKSVPSVEETAIIHVMVEEETRAGGAPSSLYAGSSSDKLVAEPAIGKDEPPTLHPVPPVPGCSLVITSSYSLADGEASKGHNLSSPTELDGKQEAPKADSGQAYVVVAKETCSVDGSESLDVKMAYEIEQAFPAASHEVPSLGDVSALLPCPPDISRSTAISTASLQPSDIEQRETKDKTPANNATSNGSDVPVRSNVAALPQPSSAPMWLRTGGRLTCVRDGPDSISANTVVPNDHILGIAPNMQNSLDMVTLLTTIFKWLPTTTLCKTARVSRAWRTLCSMPALWKRVNFRQFCVTDWDACVDMLKKMQTEELVLDRDSLEPVLCRITKLDSVKHVSLEVNPLQLARVARAFPHLLSISALISRRGTAEPLPPASLGGLSELLCVAGLECLQLRGSHGLVILPLGMTPISLAQRCQHLRVLTLVTVQNMSPAVVFLISLLSQLEELHLGECTKWSETSFLNIAKLRKLRKLTLEHGEDKSGFQLMLTRLTRLERLELRQWTLRNSLADVLPHMTCLQHLLLCPANGDLAPTNRNVLRSCLAATDNLKQITWLVSCKSLASPQAAFDLSLAFEPGNLCDCPSGIDANSADVPASGSSLKNVSPKAREVTSTHYMCCNLKNFRHVWKPSLHQTWHMTVRQVSQGLKRCLGPRTAVCFCAEVEQ